MQLKSLAAGAALLASCCSASAADVVNVGGKGTISPTSFTENEQTEFTVTPQAGYKAFAFVDGAKVDIVDGSFTATPATSVAIAYAKENAWYLDPFAKNTWNYGYAYYSQLSDAIMDENDQFLFLGENQHQFNNTNTGMYQYDVAAIKGYIGAYYGAPVTATRKKWHNPQDNFRRLMPSAAWQAVFVGNGWAAAEGVRYDNCSVFPFSADWGDTDFGGSVEGDARYYIEQSDIGNKVDQYQRVDPGCFSADGKYFYAGCYARRQISKVEVVTNAAGKIVLLRPCGSSITEVPEPLTKVTTENGIRWPLTDQTKPMGMTMSVFNKEEIVYASLANGDLVMLNGSGDTALGDQDNGERTYTVLGSFGADYFISMRVTGKADGTPHLIGQTKGGNTYVLALATDGKSLVSSSPVVKFDAKAAMPELDNAQTAFWHVTTLDDESLAFANYRGGSDKSRSMVATVVKKPANMIVRGTFGTYDEGENVEVAYGAGTTNVFTAPVGTKILGVKVNGVKDANFTASAYTNSVDVLTKNLFIEVSVGYDISSANVGGKGTLKLNQSGSVAKGGTLSGKVTNIAAGYQAVVFVDGVKVAVAQDGSFSGTVANSAKVAVTYVKDGAWYLDPFKRNEAQKYGGYSPMGGLLFGADAKYFVHGLGPDKYTGDVMGSALYVTADLVESVNPEFPACNYGDKPFINGDKESFRDVAASAEYNVVLSPARSLPTAVAYPLDKDWSTHEGCYLISNSLNTATFPAAFGHNSTYYYGRVIGGDYNNHVARYEVLADENNVITNMVANKFWQTGGMVELYSYYFGGRDILYCSIGNEIKIIDTNTDVVKTIPLPGISTVWTFCITGVEAGTPHIMVNSSLGGLRVYAMTEDLMALASDTPIAVFDKTSLDIVQQTYSTPEALDDESKMMIAYSAGNNKVRVAVYEKKPANMIVRGTFSDEAHAEADVLVTYGEAAEVVFAAPTGKKITGVKVNGVADANFTEASYTFADAALTKNVYIEITTEVLPIVERYDSTSTKVGVYGDLPSAIAAVQTGDTLKFVDNAPYHGEYLTLSGKTGVVLDLNGKTVSFLDTTSNGGAGAGYGLKLVGTTLTIKDTSVNADGKLLKLGNATFITIDVNSSVTMESGAVVIDTNYNNNGSVGACFKNEGTLTVTGGTLNSELSNTSDFVISPRAGSTTTISGGVLLGKIQTSYPGSVSIPALVGEVLNPAKFRYAYNQYITAGAGTQYVMKKGSDDLYMVQEFVPVVKVISVDGKTETQFDDLIAAFTAAQSNETVKLLGDLAITSHTVFSGKDLTFDLGGYTLSNNGASIHLIKMENSSLVITNGAMSVDNGSWAIDNTGNGHIVIAADVTITASASQSPVFPRGATLDVYGTVINKQSGMPCIWASVSGGVLNVYEGAVLQSADDAIRHRGMETDMTTVSATVNIYGGTFTAARPLYTYVLDGKPYNNGTINIYGGTFTATGSTMLDAPQQGGKTNRTKVNIIGGTFSKSGFQKTAEMTYGTLDENCTAKFAQEPNQVLTNALASACEFVKGDDNYWTVQKKVAPTPAPTPYEPIPSDDPAGDADKINQGGVAAKKAVMAPPTGATVTDDYYGLFNAVPGVGQITMELNEAGTNAVVEAVEEADTAVLTAVLGSTESTATLDVAKPLAGFYYSLKQNAAVDKLGYKADGDRNKLGGKDEISFSLDKSASSGFYQVIVTPAPVPAE